MTNEDDPDGPSGDPGTHHPTQSPAALSVPREREAKENLDSLSEAEDGKTVLLEKDIRSGERWLIGISAVGVILSAVIALIYAANCKRCGRLPELPKRRLKLQLAPLRLPTKH